MEIDGKKVKSIVECWRNKNNTKFQAVLYFPETDSKEKIDNDLNILVYRYYFDNKHNVITKEVNDE